VNPSSFAWWHCYWRHEDCLQELGIAVTKRARKFRLGYAEACAWQQFAELVPSATMMTEGLRDEVAKSPEELVAVFESVLPGAPAVMRKMFGFPAGFIHGNG
jgi:hypothetical protein